MIINAPFDDRYPAPFCSRRVRHETNDDCGVVRDPNRLVYRVFGPEHRSPRRDRLSALRGHGHGPYPSLHRALNLIPFRALWSVVYPSDCLFPGRSLGVFDRPVNGHAN